MHYRVAFPIRDLRHRSERRSVIDPCHKALRLLRAVVFLASGLVRDELRSPGFVGVPFVQHHVAVPAETVHGAARPLGYSSAEGVIAERNRPAVGSPHPGKHTVGLPFVTSVALLPAGERVGLTAVVLVVGIIRREQHTEPSLLFGVPAFRNGHIPAALVYEVASQS